jgi:FtsZ-binding cell division protein ZapB
MSIFKAHWDADGDNVRLSMPFSKVDKERRTVSGFASLDNVDKQNDIVTMEASLKAFKKFRGNIREMHQPSAVGKMVSFKEDKYFDPQTGKMYNGIYVSTYISKGAQDAWEKVLDGTYTGFSIGGRMNKWDDGYDEKSDTQIRIIKDYDLVELSLVDSPANQFASIVSVEKVDGVDVLKGDGVNTVLENVFWDKESGIVMLSENENEVSPTTGSAMENIGFVEKTDNEKTKMVKFLVDSAKGINTSKMTKEEDPMAKTTNKTEELVEKTDSVVEEAQIAPQTDTVAETSNEEVAKADDVVVAEVTEVVETPVAEVTKAEEVVVSETQEEAVVEVSKSDEVITESINEIKNTLTSAFSDLVATVKSLQAEVEMLKSTKVDLETAKDSFEAVAKDIASAKEEFDKFGKRVDAVEADTAFRKSGDLGEIVQEQPVMVEKSLWGGSFLKTADLFR